MSLQNKIFVLELGKTLGLLPFAEKSQLIKEIQHDLGGTVASVISRPEEITAVITRTSITATEFDGSLHLQEAVKHGIPVVTAAYIKACLATASSSSRNNKKSSKSSSMVKLSQFATVQFPEDSVELKAIIKEKLASFSSFSSPSTLQWIEKVKKFILPSNQQHLLEICKKEVLAKTPQAQEGIMYREYDERRSASSTAPTSDGHHHLDLPPAFPRAPDYFVVRSSLFADASTDQFCKLELHVSALHAKSKAADHHHQLFTFPYRIVQYTSSSTSHNQLHPRQDVAACFALSSEHAEEFYERQVDLAKMKFREGSQRLFASMPGIGSIVAQSDLSALMSSSSSSNTTSQQQAFIDKLLPKETSSLVSTLFRDSFYLLRERASPELVDSALSSSLSLADVQKAEGALARINSLFVKSLEALRKKQEEEESSDDSSTCTFSSANPTFSPEEKKILESASTDFFSVVKSSSKSTTKIESVEDLQKWESVIMALRGLLNVGESCMVGSNIVQAPAPVQYSALDCSITHISKKKDPSLFSEIANKLLGDNNNNVKSPNQQPHTSIKNIFQLNRSGESRRFASEVGNVNSYLCHGTHAGCVTSILQTGLQVPNVPRLRRDAGFLGRGIYFSDFETALKYSSPSSCSSSTTSSCSCYVLVCEVALGAVWETTSHQLGMTSPPIGFDSVLGVKNRSGDERLSAFQDNEFVVFKNEQVRLAYLIEVEKSSSVTSAKATLQTPPLPEVSSSGSSPSAPPLSIKDSKAKRVDENFKPPKLKAVTPGLQQQSSSAVVPLQKTVVKGRVLDLIGEFTILQEYYNNESTAIEGKYVFPLQSGAAVCVFEAYINEKKVVGVVKEKEEARKEYKAAVARGDGAYLMDESEETPDVFTISVGNLPPKCRVVIKIVYIIELSIDALTNSIEVRVPSDVHPATSDLELKVKTQDVTATRYSSSSNNNNISTTSSSSASIEVSFDMPFEITAVECSHEQTSPLTNNNNHNNNSKILRKRTQCRATIACENVNFKQNGDFILRLQMSVMKRPRIWIEENEDDVRSKAAMITFFPETDDSLGFVSGAKQKSKQREVLILLDGSASMKNGNACEHAKIGAILALKSLPSKWRFNVGIFGVSDLYCFPRSAPVRSEGDDDGDDNLAKSIEFVQSVYQPVFGGTRLHSCLEKLGQLYSADSLKAQNQRQLDILMFSDGHFPDETTLFSLFRSSPSSASSTVMNNLRIFPIAVGESPSKTSLYALSRHGRGRSAILSKDSQNQWQAVLSKHISRCAQIALTDISVEWSTEPNKTLRQAVNDSVIQSPSLIPSIFSGEHTIVYGNVFHQARQCELVAKYTGVGVDRDQYGAWPEQKFLVTANSLSMIQGKLIHRLTAKSRIRDWLEGSLMPSILDEETGKTNTPKLFSACENEAIKAATKNEIIKIGCQFGLVTPFTSMIAVEERTEEEKKRLARGESSQCTTPPIDLLSSKIQIDTIPEVTFTEEVERQKKKEEDVKNQNFFAVSIGADHETKPWNKLKMEDGSEEKKDAADEQQQKKSVTINNDSIIQQEEEGILVSNPRKYLALIEENEELCTGGGKARVLLKAQNINLDEIRGRVTEFFEENDVLSKIHSQDPDQVIHDFFSSTSVATNDDLQRKEDHHHHHHHRHGHHHHHRKPAPSKPTISHETAMTRMWNHLSAKYAPKSVRARLVSLFTEFSPSELDKLDSVMNSLLRSQPRKFQSSLDVLKHFIEQHNADSKKYLLADERAAALTKVNVVDTIHVSKPEQLVIAQNSKIKNRNELEDRHFAEILKPNAIAESIKVTTTSNQQQARVRLTNLLSKYDPRWLQQQPRVVEHLLEQYSSREEDLINKFQEHYLNNKKVEKIRDVERIMDPVGWQRRQQRMADDSSSSSYRAKALAIVERYAPDKVSRVDEWMVKFAGKEEELVSALEQKYGKVDVSDVPSCSSTASSSAPAATATATSSSSSSSSYKDRIQAIYQKYNPEKLDKVESILSSYAGREEDVLSALTKKYGAEEPSSSEVSRLSAAASVSIQQQQQQQQALDEATNGTNVFESFFGGKPPASEKQPEGKKGGVSTTYFSRMQNQSSPTSSFVTRQTVATLDDDEDDDLCAPPPPPSIPSSSLSPRQQQSSSSSLTLGLNKFASVAPSSSVPQSIQSNEGNFAGFTFSSSSSSAPPPRPSVVQKPTSFTNAREKVSDENEKAKFAAMMERDRMNLIMEEEKKKEQEEERRAPAAAAERESLMRARQEAEERARRDAEGRAILEQHRRMVEERERGRSVVSKELEENQQMKMMSSAREISSKKATEISLGKEKARETAKRISETQNRALESLKRTQAIVSETEQIGNESMMTLAKQCEQISRVNEKLDSVDDDFKMKRKSSSSFFGGNKKNKNKNRMNTKFDIGSSYTSAELFESAQQGRNDSAGDGDASNDIDECLDRISAGVTALHQQSRAMNSELKVQSVTLDDDDDNEEESETSRRRERRRRRPISSSLSSKQASASADVERDIDELQGMFADLSSVVADQSQSIDTIESSIAASHSHVESGVTQLAQASSYRSSRTANLLANNISSRLGKRKDTTRATSSSFSLSGEIDDDTNKRTRKSHQYSSPFPSQYSKGEDPFKTNVKKLGDDFMEHDRNECLTKQNQNMDLFSDLFVSFASSSASSMMHSSSASSNDEHNHHLNISTAPSSSRVQIVWKSERSVDRQIVLAVPCDGEIKYSSSTATTNGTNIEEKYLPRIRFYTSSNEEEAPLPIMTLKNVALPSCHRAGAPSILISVQVSSSDAMTQVSAVPVSALFAELFDNNNQGISVEIPKSFLSRPSVKGKTVTSPKFKLQSSSSKSSTNSADTIVNKNILGIELRNIPTHCSEDWIKSFFQDDENRHHLSVQIERCPVTGMSLGRAYVSLSTSFALRALIPTNKNNNNILFANSISSRVVDLLKNAISNNIPLSPCDIVPTAALAWQAVFSSYFSPFLSELYLKGATKPEDDIFEISKQEGVPLDEFEEKVGDFFGLSPSLFSRRLFLKDHDHSLDDVSVNKIDSSRQAVLPIFQFCASISLTAGNSLLKICPQYSSFCESMINVSSTSTSSSSSFLNRQLLPLALLIGDPTTVRHGSRYFGVQSSTENEQTHHHNHHQDLFRITNLLSNLIMSLSSHSNGGGLIFPFAVREALESSTASAEHSCEENLVLVPKSEYVFEDYRDFDYKQFVAQTSRQNTVIYQ